MLTSYCLHGTSIENEFQDTAIKSQVSAYHGKITLSELTSKFPVWPAGYALRSRTDKYIETSERNAAAVFMSVFTWRPKRQPYTIYTIAHN